MPHDSWLNWFAIWRIPTGKYGFRRTVIFFSVLCMAFLGSYYALYRVSVRKTPCFSIDGVGANGQALPNWMQIVPTYLYIDDLLPEICVSIVELLFEPAYQFDRWIRYQEWSKAGRPLTTSETEEYLSEVPSEQAELFREMMGSALPAPNK